MPCLRPNSLFKKKLRILGETNYKLHRKLLKNSSLLNVKFCPEVECFYNDKAADPSNINNQELKSEINFVIQSNTQYKHTKTLPACPGFTSLRSMIYWYWKLIRVTLFVYLFHTNIKRKV